MKDNRNEKVVKDDIDELLYKSLNKIEINNGLYLFVLCNITMIVCMMTRSTWLLVLITLIIYWLYIVIEIVTYFYYNWKFKKLFTELYEKIGEVEQIGEMPKVFKGVLKIDMVFMILTSLIAMYFYY